MLDAYENITIVKLYKECEKSGVGESHDRGCFSSIVTKLGVHYVTVICLECVINFGNLNL